MTDWLSIDQYGVHSRDVTPRPDAVVTMLWTIWRALPQEQRNNIIMQVKVAK